MLIQHSSIGIQRLSNFHEIFEAWVEHGEFFVTQAMDFSPVRTPAIFPEDRFDDVEIGFVQYCPVVSLQKWIRISNINSGSLFRRFSKGSKLSENRLTDQTVALIIKSYLQLAGINSKNYSGHSLRSGFATSAAESGAEERSIMAMTGHKSTEMVRRYIKEANLFKNNPLNKIKI